MKQLTKAHLALSPEEKETKYSFTTKIVRSKCLDNNAGLMNGAGSQSPLFTFINYSLCIITGIIMLFTSSCDKADTAADNSPLFPYHIRFIFVDSLGNNVLNSGNVNELPFDPSSFTYSSDLTAPAPGEYRFSDFYGGYVFTMYAKHYEILALPSYQESKLFHFYPCFDMKCDTMEILKKAFDRFGEADTITLGVLTIYTADHLYTDRIVYRGDTTYNLYGTALQVPYHHE